MARILIVDDSKTSRRVLTGIIEEAGHEVVGVAENGEEGFLKYKELLPDLVTLDITMPKLNGLETLKLIINESSDARVIMVSAAGQKEKIMKTLKCGAKDFITKPLDRDEIKRAVEEALK